jgi:NifU-like protein
MSIAQFLNPFTWSRYSKKLIGRIDNPYCVGFFAKADAEARDTRLASSTVGSVQDGNVVSLYWLVDKEDGVIIDAKFQVFGQTALIGAAEVACELLIGKNYIQAGRISADLIDKQVRDRSEDAAFPHETYPHLNLVLEAIEQCVEQCKDLPVAESFLTTPIPVDMADAIPGGYPGWKDLPLKKKLQVIEEVLDQDIRPYIALDGGGVTVLNLIEGKELCISYQGSCTSCYSSIGTTLSYIQQVMRAKVHPEITVVPEMNDFGGSASS